MSKQLSLGKKQLLVTFDYTESRQYSFYSSKGKKLGSEREKRSSKIGFLIRERNGVLYIAFPDTTDVIAGGVLGGSSGPVAGSKKAECVKFAQQAAASWRTCSSYTFNGRGVIDIKMKTKFLDEDGSGSARFKVSFDGNSCKFNQFTESNKLKDHYPLVPFGPQGTSRIALNEKRTGRNGKCSVR